MAETTIKSGWIPYETVRPKSLSCAVSLVWKLNSLATTSH